MPMEFQAGAAGSELGTGLNAYHRDVGHMLFSNRVHYLFRWRPF